MAVRDSLFVQATGPTGMLDVEETRVGLGALLVPGSSRVVARSGFRPGPGTSPGLVTATGTPDAFVHVAPFQLFLQTGRATVGGPYVGTVDAQFDVNVLSTPADPTNPRNDLIIAQQSDTFYGDGTSPMQIRQVVGTPSGSPVDPTVSGSADYVPLARVRVNANATTITNANITDLRSSGHAKSLTGGLYTTALGGVVPVGSVAERNALAAYDSLLAYRQDVEWIDAYDGTNWRSLGEYRATQILGASAASVTFSGIPSTLRRVRINYTTRTDNAVVSQAVNIRVNGDSGNNYRVAFTQANGGVVTITAGSGTPQLQCGVMPGASASAGLFGTGVIDITGWDAPHGGCLGVNFNSHYQEAGSYWVINGGGHFLSAAPYTSVTLLPAAGNFIAGSEFTLYGAE